MVIMMTEIKEFLIVLEKMLYFLWNQWEWNIQKDEEMCKNRNLSKHILVQL